MDSSFELEDSLMEPICDDDVVFFGPITDKEKEICEQLREHADCFGEAAVFPHKTLLKSKLELQGSECNNSDESVYKSFSVEESKYESFIDSIDGEALENQNKFLSSFLPVPTDNSKVSVNVRRGNTLYDSLEDICSLVSNADKLSLSEEVENIHVPGKQFISEDSVNPYKIENKHSDEQVHFDEDSLAILELEKTFDDSLEEFGLPPCIEVRSISCCEEKAEIVNAAEMAGVTENCLGTSAKNLPEKLSFSDSLDDKDIFSQKRFKYNSSSCSEKNDFMKDSIAESDNVCSLVSSKSKFFCENQHESVMDNCDKTRPSFFDENILDASIQVTNEKMETPNSVSKENVNAHHDSLSSSDCYAISKDSLDEVSKSNILLKDTDNELNDVNTKLNELCSDIAEEMQVSPFNDDFNASVQIVYEKIDELDCNKNALSNIHIDSKSNFTPVSKSCSGNSFEGHRMASNITEINDTYVRDIKNYKVLQNNTADSNGIQKVTTQQKNFTKSSLNEGIDGKYLSEENTIVKLTEKSFRALEVHEKSFALLNNTNSENMVSSMLIDSKENQFSDLNLKLHVQLTVADGMKQIDAKNFEISSNIGFDRENKVAVSIKSDKDMISEVETLRTDKSLRSNSKDCLQDFSQIRQKVLDKVNAKSSDAKYSVKSHTKQNEVKNLHSIRSIGNVSQASAKKENLLQALDLHDTSISHKFDSVLQSRDSIMPLNLCLKDASLNPKPVLLPGSESKENIPEIFFKTQNQQNFKQFKNSPDRNNLWKSPKQPNACSYSSPKFESKEKKGNVIQKNSATKIPIRKVDRCQAFATPKSAEVKSESARIYEKLRSPHSAKLVSHTATFPDSTPKKIPHFCMLSTSISKVPKSAAQLSTAKKYQYIQSPVGQYMRKNTPTMKFPTPVVRPLQCMINVADRNQGNEAVSHVTVRKATPQKTSKK